ncbi:hypothetical protein DE4576_03870 [Mycobacterium marinum]|nr:hypothetical protein DE4576_03870 [Mycobacterium marinum]
MVWMQRQGRARLVGPGACYGVTAVPAALERLVSPVVPVGRPGCLATAVPAERVESARRATAVVAVSAGVAGWCTAAAAPAVLADRAR